jgi:hypothetical protein
MPITSSVQAQIAFKNLLGKSQTQKNFGPNNESYGYTPNVPSTNVWSSKIPYDDPQTAVNNQIAIKVAVELQAISESQTSGKFASYIAVFGQTLSVLSTTKDPKTNLAFTYGVGSLKDIGSGSVVYDFIPDSYGLNYLVKPYTSYPSSEIPSGDIREWVYQYNSGLLFQDNVTYAAYQPPTKIVGYYYIGNKLSALDPTGPNLVRLSATGPTGPDSTYFATFSTPLISTYSITNLFLVDFAQGNTSSVKLNIDYLGTLSVYKYGASGLGELTSGDIIGGTGSTAGPTYYLTYNPDGFLEFYASNPVQTPGSYKNLNPVINNVGGIEKGYYFNDVTLQDMLTNLIYPEQLSKITSVTISNSRITPTNTGNYLIDVGRPLAGMLTFSWNYVNESNFATNSVSIVDVTSVTSPTINWPVGQSSLPFSLSGKTGTFSYTQSVFSNTPDKRIFEIRSDRKNLTRIPKYTEVEWAYRIYYGSSTSTTTSALGITGMSSVLATQSVGTFTISGTQGYKYFAVPDTTAFSFNNMTYYNLPIALATQSYTLIENGNSYATLSVTNTYSVSSTYRIYRTLNQINGTLSVNITR